jgi:hypothetical protein
LANYESHADFQQAKKGMAWLHSLAFQQLQSVKETSTFGRELIRDSSEVVIWHFPVPVYLWLIAAILAAILFVPRWREAILGSWISWAIVALSFVAGSLLIPSQNHLFGDGMTHLGNPDRVFSSTEPLDIFVHHLVYRVTGSALWSYRIIASLAFVFYLFGVSVLLKGVGTNLERGIVALAFLATGTIQFYFGYVESYTLLHMFTLYFLVFAVRDLERERLSWLPMLFFLLALVSHFSGITLLPALVHLYRRRFRIGIWWLSAGILAVGLAVAVSANLFKILVPLWPTAYSEYWLLSKYHLQDLLNILLLSGPAFFLVFWRGGIDKRQKVTLLALAGALGFAVLVDPKIGAFRDWDLMSVFAVPLTMLVALRAPRRVVTVVILLAIVILRVVPWLLFNSRPHNEYFKERVMADVHYSGGYDEGQRLISWGFLLQSLGDNSGAEQAWKKRLKFKFDDTRTIAKLAALEAILKNYDQAFVYYNLLTHSDRRSTEILYQASYYAFASGNPLAAMSVFKEVPEDSLRDPRFATLYAGLLSAQGNHHGAMQVLQQVPSVVGGAPLMLALSRSAMIEGKLDVANLLINKASIADSTDLSVKAFRDSLDTAMR